jgi:hypothetical protein
MQDGFVLGWGERERERERERFLTGLVTGSELVGGDDAQALLRRTGLVEEIVGEEGAGCPVRKPPSATTHAEASRQTHIVVPAHARAREQASRAAWTRGG